MQAPPDHVPADVEVTTPLVRLLLERQRPELASESITLLAEGWDNVIFRVGDHLLARVPRRAVGDTHLRRELRWLPGLATQLPIRVPAPLHHGTPEPEYPYSWALVPWLPGVPVGASSLAPELAVPRLGAFLRALHAIALPAEAPTNLFRAGPLSSYDAPLRRRLDKLACSGGVDRSAVLERWELLCQAPPPSIRCWCHGDLHPFNLLSDGQGGLAAVLDWGDLTAGDPAVDLMAVWLNLPLEAHPRMRAELPHVDDAMWLRGRAWGLIMALLFVEAGRAMGESGGDYERVGVQSLERVLA